MNRSRGNFLEEYERFDESASEARNFGEVKKLIDERVKINMIFLWRWFQTVIF